ncbi:ROK family protein [Streptomyces sp. DSM 44915]|uniref:ROK family protein n=1 Tax=Streptomyces chisholmiae TaxID=3075540 RepID=A0ABU2JTK7_9ACTN|nr:ROK family protein [Streptomyces sp. DSM 44915]MDT0268101.1 ROK family protein [Streptomyces sp. DSM 44915]
MSLQDQQAKYVIALDVGGTTLKAALTGPDNVPLFRARRDTATGGPAAVVDGILDFATELAAEGRARCGGPPAAAGLAVPGVVDEAAGVARYSANLGWRDLPLAGLLSERLAGVPVALSHDVRVGGLAEGRLGAGAGVGRFFFVALGTGIAGAIGVGDRMEPGAHGGAGEIGHVVVRPGGPRCGCGQYGCLETLASAAAVGRAWAEASGAAGASAADAARAVVAGDARAAAVWRAAVDALADGLLVVVNLLDPEVVIVGGGLAEAGETLLGPLRSALAAKATFQRLPTVVPAALGEAAGCLGAGLLAWDHVALPHTQEVSP